MFYRFGSKNNCKKMYFKMLFLNINYFEINLNDVFVVLFNNMIWPIFVCKLVGVIGCGKGVVCLKLPECPTDIGS